MEKSTASKLYHKAGCSNEVRLMFERFRQSDRAAGKDKRHQIVWFLLPVIKPK